MTANIYLGDCKNAKGPYELVCADAPYGINVNHSMGRRKGDKKSGYKPADWDCQSPAKEVFDHLFAISKNQIFWGANHFISKMPLDSSCWLMWDKGFSEDVTFAQFELAWTSFVGSCKKFDKHPSQQFRFHPTQKPTELYKWQFKKFFTEGVILDPFGGSMSSVIAAIDMGFDIDCYEKDEDYYFAAKKRILNHIQQLPLFGEPPIINFHE